MNLADYEQALGARLRPPLADIGFAHDATLWFTRPNPAGTETLRLGGRLEPERCLFSGTAGVYLRAVERILRPDSAGTAPTLMVPLHFLHEEREFFEWTMSAADDSVRIAAAIMAEVRTYVLPFFEKYTRTENVKRSLESADPKDWFALTSEQRVSLLATMEYVAGDTEKALRILDEALAERAKALPKKRRLLEKLRAQLGHGEVSC